MENELNAEKIVEHFNKDFNTKLQANNMEFLLSMFRTYIREDMTDMLDKQETKKLFDTEQKLYDTFSKEQKELYEKWNRLKDDYYNKMIEQSFVYGICTYKQFEKEANI